MKKILLLLLCSISFAATTAVQVDFLISGVTDSSGNPLESGVVYTYQAGTTTPTQTYTVADKSLSNGTSFTLDAVGQSTIYTDGKIKFVIKDSDDVTVKTVDNYDGRNPYQPPTSGSTDLGAPSLNFRNIYTEQINATTLNITSGLDFTGDLEFTGKLTMNGNDGSSFAMNVINDEDPGSVEEVRGLQVDVGGNSNVLGSKYGVDINMSGETGAIEYGLFIDMEETGTGGTLVGARIDLDDTSLPTDRIGMYSTVTATNNPTNIDENIAVWGVTDGTPSKNVSVYGLASGATNYNIGVKGVAQASSIGTNYGLYGKASGASTNYGLYVESGDVLVETNVSINADLRVNEIFTTQNFPATVADAATFNALTIADDEVFLLSVHSDLGRSSAIVIGTGGVPYIQVISANNVTLSGATNKVTALNSTGFVQNFFVTALNLLR